MKKTIKIMLTLAFVIAALCVPASAAGTNGFYDIGTAENVAINAYAGTNTTDAIAGESVDVDADDTAEVYYENSDRLGVTYSAATAGEDYGVILVEGSSLPTASSAIYYINQDEAASTSIAFDVYPATIEATKAAMTLYISSSAEGAGLVSVPMAYVVGYEEVVEPEPDVPTVMYGDVDGNKEIGLNDGLLALKIFAEVVEGTEEQLIAADVDGTVGVGLNDGLMILKRYAEVIESFPVEN